MHVFSLHHPPTFKTLVKRKVVIDNNTLSLADSGDRLTTASRSAHLALS